MRARSLLFLKISVRSRGATSVARWCGVRVPLCLVGPLTRFALSMVWLGILVSNGGGYVKARARANQKHKSKSGKALKEKARAMQEQELKAVNIGFTYTKHYFAKR